MVHDEPAILASTNGAHEPLGFSDEPLLVDGDWVFPRWGAELS